MLNPRWTITTLVFTLACAPEGDNAKGLSTTTTADGAQLAPSDAHVPVAPLDAASGPQKADHPGTLTDIAPPTAGGEPAAREGRLSCASEATWGSSFTPQTILLEAEIGSDGLTVNMVRTALHNIDAPPEMEAKELVSAFIWTAQTLSFSLESTETHLSLRAVPGTQGHLFTGEGITSGEVATQFVCWDDAIAPHFTYDNETGKCTDEDGREGLNPWPIEFVRETGEGECADLRGIELEEGNYSYPRLSGWNLQGAVLDGSHIQFAKLEDAELEGANLSGLTMGYAHIDGSIDHFTQLPDAHCDFFFDLTINCVL